MSIFEEYGAFDICTLLQLIIEKWVSWKREQQRGKIVRGQS